MRHVKLAFKKYKTRNRIADGISTSYIMLIFFISFSDKKDMKLVLLSILALIIFWRLNQTTVITRIPSSIKTTVSCDKLVVEFLNTKTTSSVYTKISKRLKDRKTLSPPSLRGFAPERVKQIKTLFSKKNTVVSIAQNESMRKIVMDAEKSNGPGFQFKSTWETKTTNTEVINRRIRKLNETYRLGISVDEYNDISPHELPVYAYMHFQKGLTDKQKGFLHPKDYGEDIWTLKKDNVMPNATFTLGDSFTYKGEIENLLDDSNTIPLEYVFRVSDDVVQNQMDDLHTLFLPYSDYKNVLMKHYLEQWDGQSLRGQPLMKRKNISNPNYHWSDSTIPADSEDLLRDLNYIEIQLYKSSEGKGLDLDSIESFTFTKTPPSKKLMAIFNKKKIKVFDGRIETEVPVPYSAAKSNQMVAMENSVKNRITDVEENLYRSLTQKEKDAVEKAHLYGLKKGQLPENKKYTDREVKKIEQILKKEGGFKGFHLEELLDDYLD
ncbi:MAG: hypothetical protein KAQ98_05955 [Bacteriovoracaceae bacterium]|nr:hypothetical protein [Bacteriovoracaceae bacterium]